MQPMIYEIWGGGATPGERDLVDQMFRARTRLFRDRLDWEVLVDSEGREKDAYDVSKPLYIIATDERGKHVGSMRMLPTSGPTMLAQHFAEVGDGIYFNSDQIWEVTRFCVEARDVDAMRKYGVQTMTQRLMLAGCEIGLREGWRFFVGVFDHRMKRIYSRVGWSPVVLGEANSPEGQIFLGLWEVSEAYAAKMRELGGLMDAPAIPTSEERRVTTGRRPRSDAV